MKISIPQSADQNLCVVITSPAGEVKKCLSPGHSFVEIDLPEDVREEEVGVEAVWLDSGNKPVGQVIILKEADEPELEDESDEDSPNEPVEEDAQSPSVEVADEEAEAEVEVEADDHFDGRYELGCS